MLNQYSFLFKYIIIGDASTQFGKLLRRRKIVHINAIPGKQIQDRFWDHCRSRIRVKSYRSFWLESKIADLGYSKHDLMAGRAGNIQVYYPIVLPGLDRRSFSLRCH